MFSRRQPRNELRFSLLDDRLVDTDLIACYSACRSTNVGNSLADFYSYPTLHANPIRPRTAEMQESSCSAQQLQVCQP